MAWFQHEAKLPAPLNHPNIAAVYGLDKSDGIYFPVMELVEGVMLEDCTAGKAGVPAGFFRCRRVGGAPSDAPSGASGITENS